MMRRELLRWRAQGASPNVGFPSGVQVVGRKEVRVTITAAHLCAVLALPQPVHSAHQPSGSAAGCCYLAVDLLMVSLRTCVPGRACFVAPALRFTDGWSPDCTICTL